VRAAVAADAGVLGEWGVQRDVRLRHRRWMVRCFLSDPFVTLPSYSDECAYMMLLWAARELSGVELYTCMRLFGISFCIDACMCHVHYWDA